MIKDNIDEILKTHEETGNWKDPLDEKYPEEDLELERILNSLSPEQEEALQATFTDLREIGGMPICKDNCEDLFENWLSSLSLQEVKSILN